MSNIGDEGLVRDGEEPERAMSPDSREVTDHLANAKSKGGGSGGDAPSPISSPDCETVPRSPGRPESRSAPPGGMTPSPPLVEGRERGKSDGSAAKEARDKAILASGESTDSGIERDMSDVLRANWVSMGNALKGKSGGFSPLNASPSGSPPESRTNTEGNYNPGRLEPGKTEAAERFLYIIMGAGRKNMGAGGKND